MIDLHSHVLPGIDDGTPDLAGALALARAAAAQGTRVLSATPHLRHDHPTVRLGELADRCAALTARLTEEGVELEVVPGGEADLDWATRASDAELALASYAQRGTDLLVETPYGPLPADFEERLLALAARGPRILLAHPERSAALREAPERVAALVDRGVLVQLTARGVIPGGPHHEAATGLLRAGLAHVLASDAHGATGPAPPDLAAGVAAATELVGPRARWMATDAPAAVLAGTPLPPAP